MRPANLISYTIRIKKGMLFGVVKKCFIIKVKDRSIFSQDVKRTLAQKVKTIQL